MSLVARGITCLIVDDQFDAGSGMEPLRELFRLEYFEPLRRACDRFDVNVPEVTYGVAIEGDQYGTGMPAVEIARHGGLEIARDGGSAVRLLLERARHLPHGHAVFDLVLLDVQLSDLRGNAARAQTLWLNDLLARIGGSLRDALDHDEGRRQLAMKGGWLVWSELERFAGLGTLVRPRRLLVVSGSDRLDPEPSATHAILQNSRLVVFEKKSEATVDTPKKFRRAFLEPLAEDIIRLDVRRSAVLAVRDRLRAASSYDDVASAVTSDLGQGWTLLSLQPMVVERIDRDDWTPEVNELVRFIDRHVSSRILARELYRLRRPDSRSGFYRLAHAGSHATWVIDGCSAERVAAVEQVLREVSAEIALFSADPVTEQRMRVLLAPLLDLCERAVVERSDLPAASGEESLRRAFGDAISLWSRVSLVGIAEAASSAIEKHAGSAKVRCVVPDWVKRCETAIVPASESTVPASRVVNVVEAFCEATPKYRPKSVKFEVLDGAELADAEIHGAGFVHLVVGHDGEGGLGSSTSAGEILANVAARIARGGGNVSQAAREAGEWLEVRIVSPFGSVDLSRGGRIGPVADSAEVVAWLAKEQLVVALVVTIWIARMTSGD